MSTRTDLRMITNASLCHTGILNDLSNVFETGMREKRLKIHLNASALYSSLLSANLVHREFIPRTDRNL
jgi:hypothetical protein